MKHEVQRESIAARYVDPQINISIRLRISVRKVAFVILLASSLAPSRFRRPRRCPSSSHFLPRGSLVLTRRSRGAFARMSVLRDEPGFERSRKVIATVENSSAKTTDLSSSPRFRIWKRFEIGAGDFLIRGYIAAAIFPQPWKTIAIDIGEPRSRHSLLSIECARKKTRRTRRGGQGRRATFPREELRFFICTENITRRYHLLL